VRLWCLDDETMRVRWGRCIHAAATARGWDSRLFTDAAEVDSGHAFLRIAQHPPRISGDKATATMLLGNPAVTVIPSADQIRWYEDKVAQARDLAPWMPDTRIITDMAEIDAAIEALGLPLVSKSREGSSCNNVRLVQTRAQARAEAESALSGRGIPMKLARRPARQTGYLLWQRFLAGNAYMYRVGLCGRLKWMFREGNRPGLPFASGSGLYTPIETLDDETAEVFEAASRFAAATGEAWAGLDYARDPDSGEWRLLETTLAWGMVHPASTRGCPLLDPGGTPTGRTGEGLWDALLDEIEAGVFQ
jgi:hypothetical protein